MPSDFMVQCAFDGFCERRDTASSLRRVPRDQTYLCNNCESFYCFQHSHGRPSGRPGQHCVDHDTWHPVCDYVYQCTGCFAQTCGRIHQHDSVTTYDGGVRYVPAPPDDSRFHGALRPVSLAFSGVAGTHALAQGERFIGLEIEAENGGHFDLPEAFGIVHDGSLNSYGVEVLTPPARGRVLVDRVKEAMQTLQTAGYEATESCGLHTHIDLRDKKGDSRFLARLFAIAFATEDVLYSLQNLDRHESSYSIPLRTRYPFYCAKGPSATDFEYVYQKVRKGDWGARRELREMRSTKWGDQRYMGFNFHSVFYRGTMEVRIHEGTLNADRILKWADLLQALIARAETKISYRELTDLMETKTKGVKIERMGRAFGLSDKMLDYVNSSIRPKLVEIPFGLNEAPEPEYL